MGMLSFYFMAPSYLINWIGHAQWASYNYNTKACISFFDRLQVVSTQVGGVPEVLPPDLIRLAQPTVSGTTLIYSDTSGFIL